MKVTFHILCFLICFGLIQNSYFERVKTYISDFIPSQIYNNTLIETTNLSKNLYSRFNELFKTFQEKVVNTTSQFDQEEIKNKFKSNINEVISLLSNKKEKVFEEDSESHNDYFNDLSVFVEGVMIGVSNVPYEKNECYKDMPNLKIQLTEQFQEIYNSFKTQENIIETMLGLYEYIIKIKVDNDNCNLIHLCTEITSLTYKYGIMKLVWRVVKNPLTIHNKYTEINSNFYSGNHLDAGIKLGELITIMLNYSTK